MLINLACGKKIDPPSKYKIGAKYLFIKPALSKHIRKSKNPRSVLKTVVSHNYNNLSLSDPLPSLMTLITTGKQLIK